MSINYYTTKIENMLDSTLVAQIGVMLQHYLTIRTLLMIDWKTLDIDGWHRKVKSEVEKLSDPLIDIYTAYEILENIQKYKCRRCNADLTFDKNPTLDRKDRNIKFLGMNSVRTEFDWNCEMCSQDC